MHGGFADQSAVVRTQASGAIDPKLARQGDQAPAALRTGAGHEEHVLSERIAILGGAVLLQVPRAGVEAIRELAELLAGECHAFDVP